MSDRIFIDTNVLVYAYDRTEPKKQMRALEVLDHLVIDGVGVVSTQVLAEFCVATTHKLAVPLSVNEAYERVKNYLQSWTVVDVTGMIVLEAVRGVRDYKFNFWDAQIWATARLNQIPLIFSEDFNVGQVIEGVRVVNPFAEEFQSEDWLGL
jgi:predicted nucleic acid-binding protein